MNTLEVKGSLFDLLWGIEDEETLLKIREVVYSIIEQSIHNQPDWWDELPVAQQERLGKALRDMEQKINITSHEAVIAKIQERIKTYPK